MKKKLLLIINRRESSENDPTHDNVGSGVRKLMRQSFKELNYQMKDASQTEPSEQGRISSGPDTGCKYSRIPQQGCQHPRCFSKADHVLYIVVQLIWCFRNTFLLTHKLGTACSIEMDV